MCINKFLLLWNEYGDPQIIFQNLSFYNINNQSTKFDKTFLAGSILEELPYD